MLLLDQVHTAVAKGKTFQTSPPPTDNDPEDPWKVQVAKPGPPRKHVWVSWHSIRIVHCPLRGRRSFCVVSVADGCLRSSHHIDCVRPASDPLCDLQTKTGSDSASRAFVGLLVHSAAGELSIDALLPCCCPKLWHLACVPTGPGLPFLLACASALHSSNSVLMAVSMQLCLGGYHRTTRSKTRHPQFSCFCADGFAVGAASRSSSSSLGLTIAVAMVLHKAPVAFGLATSFMTAKWSWQKSQKALFAFSSASPFSALLTYGLIGAVPALSSASSTALCVLFSGGTFLYAACMHILPEIVGHDASLNMVQLGAVLCGSILPLLLTLATPHVH